MATDGSGIPQKYLLSGRMACFSMSGSISFTIHGYILLIKIKNISAHREIEQIFAESPMTLLVSVAIWSLLCYILYKSVHTSFWGS